MGWLLYMMWDFGAKKTAGGFSLAVWIFFDSIAWFDQAAVVEKDLFAAKSISSELLK